MHVAGGKKILAMHDGTIKEKKCYNKDLADVNAKTNFELLK